MTNEPNIKGIGKPFFLWLRIIIEKKKIFGSQTCGSQLHLVKISIPRKCQFFQPTVGDTKVLSHHLSIIRRV